MTITRKVVIESASGKVLRHGYSDFANDQTLNPDTEEIIESGYVFEPDIDRWNWYWTGSEFVPVGKRIYTEDAKPFFALTPHRIYATPKVKKIPNTNVPAREFKGDRAEGFEAGILLLNDVGYEREVAVVIRYAFVHSMTSKAAAFRMNYAIIHPGDDFANSPPVDRSMGALLTDIARAPEDPDDYTMLENSQLAIPDILLRAGDIILIEDFYRDFEHAEDTNDDVWAISFEAVVRTQTVEDEDVYMCEGEKSSGALGQGNSETVEIDLSVAAPSVFSKKGMLEMIKVVATGGIAGTSTNFTVEIFEDSGETKLICKSTGHDSTVAPWYGKYECCAAIPFKNADSPQAAKLYVKITNVTDTGSTTFDVCLRGKELK